MTLVNALSFSCLIIFLKSGLCSHIYEVSSTFALFFEVVMADKRVVYVIRQEIFHEQVDLGLYTRFKNHANYNLGFLKSCHVYY